MVATADEDPATESELAAPGAEMAAETELLGLIGCVELFAFETLARDSALATTLEAKAALGAIACREYENFAAISGRLIDMGVDPEEALGAFVPTLTEFHRKTAPRDLLEGLVKAYVGHGISADFGREISQYVGPEAKEFVEGVLTDPEREEYIVSRIHEYLRADPGATGRLALWGRRLMGEALAQAQQVAAERPDLARVVLGMSAGSIRGGAVGVARSGAAESEGGVGLVAFSEMLTRLTDAHSERMQNLGLAP